MKLITSGSDAKFALLGGRSVGEMTLNRFYVLHCVAIPLAAAPLIMIHFWRVRKDGGISGPDVTAASLLGAGGGRAGRLIRSRNPESSSQINSCIHEDLTAPVLAGLAWYYLLAAMMNAAAAAYVSYGEMVSAGASRLGLAPKTRRMPVWLIGSFFALYGLAFLMILFRQSLPGAWRSSTGLCAAANALLAVIAGADAAHFAEMKSPRPWRGRPVEPAEPRRSPAGRRLGGPINRTLWTLIWSIAAVIFQAMGITYILGGIRSCMPQFCRDAVDFVAGPTTFFVGATLGFIARPALAAVLRQRTCRLGDGESVPALFRSEHDRLRLPRHRHQARQCADRRPADPRRLFRLVRPASGRDQRRPDRPGPAHARGISSPRRP